MDRLMHKSGSMTALAVAGIFAAASPPAGAAKVPDWDQVANIKDAAQRLGAIHRTRGAAGAYKFVEDCYKTHTLARKYSQGMEACIAQDYLQTRVLASVYSRMTPQALTQMGMPSRQALAQAMGRRISGAFAQYNVTVAQAEAFKKLVDRHGFPVFVSIVFPNSDAPADAKPLPEKK